MNGHMILENDTQTNMVKADRFLALLQKKQDLPRKYDTRTRAVFDKQFAELSLPERYSSCELLLSNAWSFIDNQSHNKAQEEICLVVPLCAKHKWPFSDFEVDKMMWECWINNSQLEDQEKEENWLLLEQCGFQFEKYKRQKQTPKNGVLETVWKMLTCGCLV